MKTKINLKNRIAGVLFLLATLSNAQTYVDNNTGATAAFSDLQAAIDAASPNDVIYVQPSPNSYGTVTVNKPLTIIGRSHSLNNFISEIGSITINEGGSGTTLKGLKISSGSLGIIIKGKSSEGAGIPPVIVSNIAVLNCSFSTIAIESLPYQTSSVGGNNILIQGCVFRQVTWGYASNLTISNNVIVSGGTFQIPTSTKISNNLFIGQHPNISKIPNTTGTFTIQNSMFINNGSTNNDLNLWDSKLENCLTYNYGSGNYDIGTSTNLQTSNVLSNTNPMFTNFTPDANISFKLDADYTLQTGSPAIGAGVNGEDLGIFSGFNFNNLGVPSGYPTVNIVSSTPSLPQNGSLKVTLTAKSQ